MKFKWTGLSTTLAILAAILTVVASWAIYKIAYQFFTDLTLKFGVESFYLQNLMILVIAVGLLLLMGYSVNKLKKKIFG